MKVDIRITETIGINLWHAPNLFEKEVRDAFCSAITPGCKALDVGANIDIYTLLAAKSGAQVFSIEADPRNAEMLRHHVNINGFNDRVTISEIAAMDAPKQFPLFRNQNNFGGSKIVPGSERAVTVFGKTIDSLNLPPIDVCKMDIEGSEPFALKGMRSNIIALSANGFSG